MRNRELILSGTIIASGLGVALGINEYKIFQESEHIDERNGRIDKCIENLSQNCLTAAGVELQITYNDLSFESNRAMVDPEYFKMELESKRPEPINVKNRRIGFGLGGALLGGLAASALIHRNKISSYVSKTLLSKNLQQAKDCESDSDVFGSSS